MIRYTAVFGLIMAAMESWGTELWDKYSELTAHAHNGIDFLENYVARSVANCNLQSANYFLLRTLINELWWSLQGDPCVSCSRTTFC